MFKILALSLMLTTMVLTHCVGLRHQKLIRTEFEDFLTYFEQLEGCG